MGQQDLEDRFESHPRLSPDHTLELGAVPYDRNLLAAADQGRVDPHVLLPVEAHQIERLGHQLTHGVPFAGGDDEVARRLAIEESD